MILHRITLENFGIYAGETTFDLTPHADDHFQRPVLLFRGKNGVGKSTLVEAIRLCLHGRLSLGVRTRQRDYAAYLRQWLHRSAEGVAADSAHVLLEFEHVQLGRRRRYRVRRGWRESGRQLVVDLHIWVDGELLIDDEEEREHLLRELIPVGVAELFFFDGEKIATLAEEGAVGDDLLADTVQNLLGLHLVDQLDRDLDVYLTRQPGASEMGALQTELDQLLGDEAAFSRQLEGVRVQLDECRRGMQAKGKAIALAEKKIAQEGGRYAQEKEAREAERAQVAAAIAQVEQEIQELSRGVMPFAVAPNMLRAVRERLEAEAAYARWQASRPVVEAIEDILQEPPAAYDTDGGATKAEPDARLLRIQELVRSQSQPPIPDSEVVHRVSPETRGVLLNWIDEALTTAPRQLVDAIQRRSRLLAQAAGLEETLARTPLAEVLHPLQENLRQLDREFGRLEAEQASLLAEEQRLTYHLERIGGSKRRLSEQMASVNSEEKSIHLAARTKLLLDAYRQQLTARKLEQLENRLRQRFNQLSRKRGFVERVAIDPHSFGVTLYRAGQPFPRSQLSAGEQQIFAVATLWALREVSERPLPVIIDTPLSRLDEDHRRAMLAEFLPQVAQQVIVLATTAEIDDETFAFLQPAVSRAYLLEAEHASAHAREQTAVEQKPLIQLQ